MGNGSLSIAFAIPILAREKTALWAYGHIVFSRFFLRLKARPQENAQPV
jgi:hypothetical protein